MAVYEYIPFAAIAAGISKLTGARDRITYLLLEGEVTDSVTGEKLGRSVRRVQAEKLLENDEEQLTVEMVQSAIDKKSEIIRETFDRVLK